MHAGSTKTNALLPGVPTGLEAATGMMKLPWLPLLLQRSQKLLTGRHHHLPTTTPGVRLPKNVCGWVVGAYKCVCVYLFARYEGVDATDNDSPEFHRKSTSYLVCFFCEIFGYNSELVCVCARACVAMCRWPVSYTHLTLPTICSV